MYFKNISRVVLQNTLERQATACQESFFSSLIESTIFLMSIGDS